MAQQKRKVQIVDSSVSERRLSWEHCIICTEQTNEPVVCATENGRQSLAEDLASYSEYAPIPTHLQVTDLQSTITKNSVKYHKTCRAKFNAQKIERARKRLKLNQDSEDKSSAVADSGNTGYEAAEATSSQRLTRSVQPLPDIKKICIFCDEDSSKEKLVNASTLDIGPNIYSQAMTLQDDKLLSKLSSTDFVALEIKYHKLCYVRFLTRVRSSKRAEATDESSDCKTAYGSVLSEVVSYMQDLYVSSSTAPVFRLSHILSIVEDRLLQLGYENVDVNRTRLKDELLAFIPGLREDKVGREVMLSFEGDVRSAIQEACETSAISDGMCLARAANILRQEMFNAFPQFQGSFAGSFTSINCVPSKAVMFIRMVLEGACAGNPYDSDEITEDDVSRIPTAAQSIAQLLRFNTVKRRKRVALRAPRHNRNRETPLPVYLGLMLHQRTQKKTVIDKMHGLGLCISYDRVQELSSRVTKCVLNLYEREGGVVCPPSLVKNVFTSGAIDNIDHNPTSNTSKESFHGTSISLIQNVSVTATTSCTLNLGDPNISKSNPQLPEAYIRLPPTPKCECDVPLQSVNYTIPDISADPISELTDWFHHVQDTVLSSTDATLPWAVYQSRNEIQTDSDVKCISALLPLLKEEVASFSMVRHTMDIISSAVKKLNPSQIPVITADQPVYAIARQVQWKYPDQYGESKMFVMLGGLHIEMAVISMIGSWLAESGWAENLVKAGITTTGKADSILKSSHVKRSRYAHEVAISVLHMLKMKAYQREKEMTNISNDIHQWTEQKKKESPQFLYWNTVLELEALLFLFVKSLRTGNFLLFVSTLKKICPWMFVLDHVNYARWLSVYVHNLLQLPDIHPEIYNEFMNGNFTSQKTRKKFSRIPHDQVHEQNNKLVKGDTSVLSLLSNESSLLKWMTGGPEIMRIISEFEDVAQCGNNRPSIYKHHEDSGAFSQRYREHVNNLTKVFEENGNPFEELELATVDNRKVIMNADAVKSVMSAAEVGMDQYATYVNDRLVFGKLSIHDVIKKNSLSLFKNPKVRVVSKDRQNVISLRKDSDLFCKLYVASQVRKGNIAEFFSHENNQFPPSLSDNGKLRKPSNKADILSFLVPSE